VLNSFKDAPSPPPMKKMCLEKSSKEAPQICPSQKKVCWEKKNSKEILKVCHSKKNCNFKCGTIEFWTIHQLISNILLVTAKTQVYENFKIIIYQTIKQYDWFWQISSNVQNIFYYQPSNYMFSNLSTIVCKLC